MAKILKSRARNGSRIAGCSDGGMRSLAEILRSRINYLQANSLGPNWGQTIFQTANEIAANTIFRKRLDEIQSQTASEKAWWDKRRASIQDQFMAELDEPATASTKTNISKANSVSSDEPIMVEAGEPAVTDKGSKKKKGKN